MGGSLPRRRHAWLGPRRQDTRGSQRGPGSILTVEDSIHSYDNERAKTTSPLANYAANLYGRVRIWDSWRFWGGEGAWKAKRYFCFSVAVDTMRCVEGSVALQGRLGAMSILAWIWREERSMRVDLI